MDLQGVGGTLSLTTQPLIEKGKHVGFPYLDTDQRKRVTVLRRRAYRRVDLEAMLLPELGQTFVHRLPGVQGIIVRGVDEEDGRADVRQSSEQTRSQIGRTIPAVASCRKDDERSDRRLALRHQNRQGAAE